MTASWSVTKPRVVGAACPLAAAADFSAACAVLAGDAVSELLIDRASAGDEPLAQATWDARVASGQAFALPAIPVERPVLVWVLRTAAGEPPWWDDLCDALVQRGALVHAEDRAGVPARVCVVDRERADGVREAWAQEFRDQAVAAVRAADQPHAVAMALRLARRAACLAPSPRPREVGVLVAAYRLAGLDVDGGLAECGVGDELRAAAVACADELLAGRAGRAEPDLEARQIRERVREQLFGQSHDRQRYQIRGRLGAGGMGVVYRAFDPILDCEVALKQLNARQTAESGGVIAQLRREARHMARLRGNPNIVTLYDFFAEDDHEFVVMELVEGTNLREWQDKQRSWRVKLDMYLQAGVGLGHAHAEDLVHRDFKPENVLVGKHGAKVADFGLAQSHAAPTLDGAAGSGEGGAASRTLSGTLYYMAPEQFELGGAIGPAADQYSYCVAIYEALFGEHPILPREVRAADTRVRSVRGDHPLVVAIRGGKFQAPPRGHGVPGHIVQALRRGLDREPSERFGSIGELLAALRARPWRRRVGYAAAAVTVAGGLAVWTLTPAPLTRDEQRAAAGREIEGSLDIAGLRARPGSDAAGALIDALAATSAQFASAVGDQRFADQEHGPGLESATRTACLDLTRARLLDVAASLRSVGMFDRIGAADLMAALPDPEECRVLPADYLRCRVDEQAELERGDTAAIVAKLRAGERDEAAGNFGGASEHAAGAMMLAERARLPLLQTRAGLLAGRIHQLREQPEEAIAALQRAYDQVEAGACLDLRADIASRIVKVVAQNPSLPLSDGEKWARSGANLAAKIPLDRRRTATARSDAGLLELLRDGDPERARDELQAAIELRAGLSGPGVASEQADSQLNLGNALVSLGEHARARVALDEALRLRTAALGAEHPLLYREHYARAQLELAAGATDAANAALDPAERLAAGFGVDSGPMASVLLERAVVLAHLDRKKEAAAAAMRAAGTAERARMDPLSRAEIEAALGGMLAFNGEPDRGIAVLERLGPMIRDAPWVGQVFGLVRLNLAQAHDLAGHAVAAERGADEVLAWLATPGIPDDDATLTAALLLRGETRLELAATSPERLAGAIADLERLLAMPALDVDRAPLVRLFLGRALQLRGQPGDLARGCAQLAEGMALGPWLAAHEERHAARVYPVLHAACDGLEKIGRAHDRTRPGPTR